MKARTLILTALTFGAGIVNADVIGEWTFDTGSTSGGRRAASGLVPGVASLTALEFNTFDDVGPGAIPNAMHDGIGFGGNSGEQVAFIHRAEYFDDSAVPSPRPTADDFTSFGAGDVQGTTAGEGNGHAPVSFTVTAQAGARIIIYSLAVEWLSGSALIAGFQEAGADAGQTVTLNSGNKTDAAVLNAPVVIEAGEAKTFTISLNSGALNSFHNINAFALHGSVELISEPPEKTAGVFYSTLYAYDPAYRVTRITEFGVGNDLEQKLFGNIDSDIEGRDDALAIYSSALNASQTVWRVEAALSDGSDFVSPSTWLSWTNFTGTVTAMVGDVDGDGDEDLVFFNENGGTWNVALSTGSRFDAPVLWSAGNGVGSSYQFLEDLDGDGKDDAVISWQSWNGGDWRAARSSGEGFGPFEIKEQAFGDGMTHFVCDLNNDAKADFIAFDPASGTWDISINADPDFIQALAIESGFGIEPEFATVYDVDTNGSGDFVIVEAADSKGRVRYLNNNLSLVQPRHNWIAGGLCAFRTLYDDEQLSIASMDGSGKAQLFTSYNGTWQALPPNPVKSQTLVGYRMNTWELWPNHYLPRYPTNNTPNVYGYYDSGDPDVNDAQIKQMHDLGFNYVMFDITNGHHAWVDDRAKAFIERIRYWNDNLQPGQRRMYFCISLGRTRGIKEHGAFFAKLEAECQRAWDEFYSTNLDLVYYLHGRPLLVHMLDGSAEPFWPDLETWAGPRDYIDRMTNRTFRNWDRHEDDAPYGWVIEDQTPTHDPNLMTIQPGFGNGSIVYSHDNGNRYKGHWLDVLKNDPDSVFVVSWNEWWENNAIEPARMFRNDTEAYWMGGKGYPPIGNEPGLEAYTDERGAPMDDYYFVMTRQYLRLFLNGSFEAGTYFKEETHPAVYRATSHGFVHETALPSQAPVLWLPDGYLASNAGYLAYSNRYQLVHGPYGHDDADGLDNLTEYGLGGDPTNALDTGYPIHFAIDGGSAKFVHPRLSDPFSGIRYDLEVTDNLVSNVWTTNGYVVSGTSVDAYSTGLDAVTNRISTDEKDQQFIRLKIEQL